MSKFRVLGAITLVAAIMAVAFLLRIPTYVKLLKDDVISINEVAKNGLEKGDVVDGIADYSLGCVAEEYETNFGIRTSDDSTKLYYVLWLDNENFILYETANKNQYDLLETITEETYAYLDSMAVYEESGDMNDLVVPTTTLEIEGVVSEIPSEIEGYFKEWYDEVFGDGEYAAYCEPVMISNTNFDSVGTMVYIGAGCAVVAIILGVVMLVLWRKEKNDSYGY